MKPRRREIKVFSMSALDLFASGMGAFILLTIMALPFFPNTGDSAEEVEKLQAQLQQANRERAAAQSRAASLESVLSRLQNGAEVRQALEDALTEAQEKLADAERRANDLEEALAKAREPKPEQEQDDERERALEASLEEARQQLDDAEKRAQSLEQALAKARLPDLDLVICLDVTGSMRDQIDGLKREIAALAQILDKLAPSAGMGIVAFGDRRWRQTLWEQPIVETSNIARLQSFVNTLEPNMGDPRAERNRDYPEAVATALEHATGLNWRSESERHYIVVVTDNAAYPEREATAVQIAQRFASQDGQQVSTVRANFVPDQAAWQAADRFLRQLAVAGRGQFVDAAGGESMVGSLLLAILAI